MSSFWGGGRQRRAPPSRAQGYGGRRTGSYQLLAFPRGEKVRARLGGDGEGGVGGEGGGERDKNRVRRFVPCTARRHPRPCAEAACRGGPAGPAARAEEPCGGRGGSGGQDPSAGHPGGGGGGGGQPGLGAAGAALAEVPRESLGAGCGRSLGATRVSPRSDKPPPALLFPQRRGGGDASEAWGAGRGPPEHPTPGRSPGVGGRHRLWSGGGGKTPMPVPGGTRAVPPLSSHPRAVLGAPARAPLTYPMVLLSPTARRQEGAAAGWQPGQPPLHGQHRWGGGTDPSWGGPRGPWGSRRRRRAAGAGRADAESAKGRAGRQRRQHRGAPRGPAAAAGCLPSAPRRGDPPQAPRPRPGAGDGSRRQRRRDPARIYQHAKNNKKNKTNQKSTPKTGMHPQRAAKGLTCAN